MPGAAIQDFWLNGWGPTAPPTKPTQPAPAAEGLIGRKRLIELSCRLTGTVKQKTSETLTLHGSTLAQTMLQSELRGQVKQEVKQQAFMLTGSCLKASSLTFKLKGRNMAVFWMADIDEDDDEP